jgi:Rrf2 family protein
MPLFPLLSRSCILAMAAVIEIAICAEERPISSKILTRRLKVASRSIEPLLQGLAKEGILKGFRGRSGGYQLLRARSRITAEDIVRAATTKENVNGLSFARIDMVETLMPVLGQAEYALSRVLGRIRLKDLCSAKLKIAKLMQNSRSR